MEYEHGSMLLLVAIPLFLGTSYELNSLGLQTSWGKKSNDEYYKLF